MKPYTSFRYAVEISRAPWHIAVHFKSIQKYLEQMKGWSVKDKRGCQWLQIRDLSKRTCEAATRMAAIRRAKRNFGSLYSQSSRVCASLSTREIRYLVRDWAGRLNKPQGIWNTLTAR